MNASVITLAANVNDILSRYILIHDQIIKFSIRKLIPIPGLFKAIPFCTHENDLDALLGELAANRDSISDHLIGLRGVATAEGEFTECLTNYSAALNDTIYQLHGISSELCLKSRGEGDYPYRRYRADLDSYKESVDRYRQIGDRLNVLYRTMAE